MCERCLFVFDLYVHTSKLEGEGKRGRARKRERWGNEWRGRERVRDRKRNTQYTDRHYRPFRSSPGDSDNFQMSYEPAVSLSQHELKCYKRTHERTHKRTHERRRTQQRMQIYIIQLQVTCRLCYALNRRRARTFIIIIVF